MGFSIILLLLILAYSGFMLRKFFKKKLSGDCCNNPQKSGDQK